MPATIPYVVSIVVYDSSDVAKEGVTVTAKNEASGETITGATLTNALGQTLIDLANFPSGYTDGDFIQITASGTGNLGQDLRFKAVAYGTFNQINELNITYET